MPINVFSSESALKSEGLGARMAEVDFSQASRACFAENFTPFQEVKIVELNNLFGYEWPVLFSQLIMNHFQNPNFENCWIPNAATPGVTYPNFYLINKTYVKWVGFIEFINVQTTI